VTTSVPGPPASVLAAILRADAAHPYDGTNPRQRRRAWFSGSPSFPDLPSLINDGVFMPQNAELDANIVTTGTFATGGSSTAAVAALTSGTTISVDASQGNTFTITLTGADTLANPTNPTDGQRVIFAVTQGSGGSHTLSYGTAYEFSASLPAPTLSTSAGVTDYLGFVYSAAAGQWRFLAFQGGFA
jgi:hypothetical protein